VASLPCHYATPVFRHRAPGCHHPLHVEARHASWPLVVRLSHRQVTPAPAASVASVICKRGLEHRSQSPATAPEYSPAYHRGYLLPFWRVSESPASQRRHSLRATLSWAQRLTGQPHYAQPHLRICASWRRRSGHHLRVHVRHMMQRPACQRRSQLGWRFSRNFKSVAISL
jgi:hypothetical protein